MQLSHAWLGRTGRLEHPGLRHFARGVVAVTEYPEQSTHLYERRSAGLGGSLHRARRGFRLRLHRDRGSLAQRDDHRERVSDDVVHLARDPRSLCCCSQLRTLLALGSQLVSSVDQRLDVAAPISEVDGDEQYCEQPERVQHGKCDRRTQVGVGAGDDAGRPDRASRRVAGEESECSVRHHRE